MENLVLLISEVEFANDLLREFISFHEFKRLPVPELLIFLLFLAADLLNLNFFVKFSRKQSISLIRPVASHEFSPVLILVIQFDSHFSRNLDAHLDRHNTSTIKWSKMLMIVQPSKLSQYSCPE